MWMVLLVVWCVEGNPHYASEGLGQTIACVNWAALPRSPRLTDFSFVSDVGAQPRLQPVFISLGTTTAMFFVATTVVHLGCRWNIDDCPLRILSIASGILSLAGSACLISLTILDDLHHRLIHYVLLSTALPAYFFSSIALCLHDYFVICRARREQRQHCDEHEKLVADGQRLLGFGWTVLWIRVGVLGVEFILLTLFSAMCWDGNSTFWDAAGVLEWCIAGVFSLYLSTFCIAR